MEHFMGTIQTLQNITFMVHKNRKQHGTSQTH